MGSIIERNKRIGADVKRAAFMVKQQQSYEFKKKYAAIRAREFVGMCDEHDKNYHVSDYIGVSWTPETNPLVTLDAGAKHY